MRTPAQIAASRQNGKKSQGPTTIPGKSISRRNALKSGFAGNGHVLSHSMQSEVESQKACLTSLYNPSSPEAHALVETAALAFIRTLHIMRTQHELGIQRVRYALPLHDAARQSRVQTLANHLSAAPQHALNQLQSFTEGCDYLADAFDTLAAELKATGTLSADSQLHARHLHGLTESAYPTTPELTTFLTNLSTLPHPRISPLPRGEGQGEGLHTLNTFPEPSSNHAPITPSAIAILTHLESQSEAWQDAADTLWQTRDEADRNDAPNRAYFDPSIEAQRLHRYLTRAQRTHVNAIKALEASIPTPTTPTIPKPAPARPQPPMKRKNEPTTSQPLSHYDFEAILNTSTPTAPSANPSSTFVDFAITLPQKGSSPAKRVQR